MRGFSPSAAPSAQRWYADLQARDCLTDVRGDVLRVGFGIYQDETDVERVLSSTGPNLTI